MQDIEKLENSISDFQEYKIKPYDILKINIYSESNITTKILESQNSNFSNNRESLMFDGFNVDKSGYLDHPTVGKIYVSGLSVSELEALISEKLSTLEIFYDSSIDVKVLTWNFTILGEVNNPGKYYFNQENLNIIQAIGIAGDLTINGRRDNIRLIRFDKNEYSVSKVDLTKSEILNRNEFQILSGDVIIVDPNFTRVKNAGIIGNSGTLINLLSFLLTSIILITNN